MSTLFYDGQSHQLTMMGADGRAIRTWTAYNNTDRRATLRHVANGTYRFIDATAPKPHEPATPNSSYGSYGIMRFDVPGHSGVGVHSGQASNSHLPGPPHPTMGCVRTTDAAMGVIVATVGSDPLTTITIVNNTQHMALHGTVVHASHVR